MNPRYQSVVIKVGTSVITKETGLLNEGVMRSLTQQISALCDAGVRVILVSSGAMAAGRATAKIHGKLTKVAERQLLAAVGQVHLIETYARLFKAHGYMPAQVLATKEDFRDRQHYLNMRSCMETLVAQKIIPIVNENDVISVDELMFTDNDELAGLIASMMDVDALILLTSVDGIYDGDPKNAESRVIETIDADDESIKQFIRPDLSQFGRGGMLTKVANARKLAMLGIATHIANGKTKDVLQDILRGEKIGTTFPAQKQATSLKRWVAGSAGTEKGTVTVNECAVDILRARDKAVSLLPVGIIKVEGAFEKGDVIRIQSEKGVQIGLGIARYGAASAKKFMGKKNQKPLIHYDYLFLS
ncbi:MAG: glutamate 5-kinase [Candidatus Peregrinibacteria bacterium]|nr:glutamate 5-kinase [Candidatus Peregrinibacteria bacterium]